MKAKQADVLPKKGGLAVDADFQARCDAALLHAEAMAQTTADWMEVFNSVFGPGAIFSTLFPSPADRLAFASTAQRTRLFDLLHRLRGKNGDRSAKSESDHAIASGSFRLRLPSALHEALVAEAKVQGVSLNQLCLAKLAVQLHDAVRPRVAG